MINKYPKTISSFHKLKRLCYFININFCKRNVKLGKKSQRRKIITQRQVCYGN